MRLRWRPLLVLGAVLFLPAPAPAEETVAVRLTYAADFGCPGLAEFIDAVRARTPLARFDDASASGIAVSVTVKLDGAMSHGVLLSEGSLPRDVSGGSCADVTRALALVLALAVDPQALATTAPAAGETSPASSAFPPPPTSAPPGVATAPTFVPPLPPPQPPPPPPIDVVASAEPKFYWGVGADFVASTGFGKAWPSFLGPDIGVELGTRYDRRFAPSLRLHGALDFSAGLAPSSGAAELRLYRARLDLRPVRLGPERFTFVPYAGLEAGSLVGQGKAGLAIVDVQRQSRPWVALAQGFTLELALTHVIYLNISAEVREPLIPLRFVFQTPDVDIAEVPKAEISGAIGAAARFW